MAQPSGQALEGSVEQGGGSLLDPRTSYAGRLFLVAMFGVVASVGAGLVAGTQLGASRRAAAAAGGVGAVVVLVVVLVVYRTAVRPLRDLDRRVGAVVDGDREVDLGVSRSDEIGRLARRVAQLRDEVDDRSGQVESLNRQVTRAVRDQLSVAEGVGEGDLTLRMDTDTGVSQFDALAEDFNAVVDDTAGVVGASRQFAAEVDRASTAVGGNVDRVRERLDAAEAATRRVDQGLADQDERLARTAEEMANLSGTIEDVAASTDRLTDRFDRTTEATSEGRAAVEAVLDDLAAVEERSDEATAAAENLATQVDDVDEVVALIRDIADETNLLAVNAQIEAAHAGEVGEGFGIVADKIKNLADDTAEAAERIEDSLSDLRDQTDETTDRIAATRETATETTDTVADAVAAVDDIEAVVEDTGDSVEQISQAARMQATTAEDIVQAIDEVATLSERTAAVTDEVVDSLEAGRGDLAAIDDDVDALAAGATHLSGTLDQFTVEETSGRGEAVGSD